MASSASVHYFARDDVVPGMIAAIQTHGELLHRNPHIHTRLTCRAFTTEGDFLEVPELDMDRLREAWREAVFALYLAEEKIEPEVVENMSGWPAQRVQRLSGNVKYGAIWTYIHASTRRGQRNSAECVVKEHLHRRKSLLPKDLLFGQPLSVDQSVFLSAGDRAVGRRLGL